MERGKAMGKPGQSATDLGRHFKATGEEINLLLKDQGFTYGSPGAYGVTQKGAPFGIQEYHQRGNGGYAYMNPSWEQTYWDDSIREVLEVTPERLAKVSADISANRLARSAARKAAQADADAAFLASQASDAAQSTSTTIDPRKLLIWVGLALLTVGVGYGIYNLSPVIKRKWDDSAVPSLSKLKERIAGRTSETDEDADPSQ